jgi:pimeloyl-ACP methyl ester carboxylesterase
LLLLPGLLCDEMLWANQVVSLVDLANISVVDLRRDNNTEAVGARTLSETPNRFALAGLSMGGYGAQEIMRQAPKGVTRFALHDTSDLADTPKQCQQHSGFIG